MEDDNGAMPSDQPMPTKAEPVTQAPLVEPDTDMEGQAVPHDNGGHDPLRDMPVSCAPMAPDEDMDDKHHYLIVTCHPCSHPASSVHMKLAYPLGDPVLH